MSRARTKRLARLARAQRAIAELSALEHQRLSDAHAQSAAEAGKIVEALNGDSPLHGLLVDVMANALLRNAIDTARLSNQRNLAAEAQRYQTARADAFDRRLDRAERTLSKAEARCALERLLEEYAANRG